MPKQQFSKGVLAIVLDPNDPHDAAEIKVNGHKGTSIQAMQPQDMKDLLTALNQIYNLGLTP